MPSYFETKIIDGAEIFLKGFDGSYANWIVYGNVSD